MDRDMTGEEVLAEQARQIKAQNDCFTDLQMHLNNSLDTLGTRTAHPLDEQWTPPYPEGGE